MPLDPEVAARANLARVLPDLRPEQIDPDADLVNEYGLTSLDKVLFLTSVCDDAGVELSAFTEHDVARMHTLRDVTEALVRGAQRVG
jgi:acyl carrier protein